MERTEIKKILCKQLELLAEKSEKVSVTNSAIENLTKLTNAMCLVAETIMQA